MPKKQLLTSSNTLPKKPKQQTPEEFGKMLIELYETGYLNSKRAYKHSFLKGLLSGFGGVLGATLLIALLLWLLSLASHVPLIGRAVENVRQTIQTSPQQ